jgi:hypothetical protein
MKDKPTYTDFLNHLHDTVHIYFIENKPIDAEIIEVIELNTAARDPKLESFSVIFRSQEQEPVTQGIYRIKHSALGDLNLFLVPIGPDDQGMCFEAVFNYRT